MSSAAWALGAARPCSQFSSVRTLVRSQAARTARETFSSFRSRVISVDVNSGADLMGSMWVRSVRRSGSMGVRRRGARVFARPLSATCVVGVAVDDLGRGIAGVLEMIPPRGVPVEFELMVRRVGRSMSSGLGRGITGAASRIAGTEVGFLSVSCVCVDAGAGRGIFGAGRLMIGTAAIEIVPAPPPGASLSAEVGAIGAVLLALSGAGAAVSSPPNRSPCVDGSKPDFFFVFMSHDYTRIAALRNMRSFMVADIA